MPAPSQRRSRATGGGDGIDYSSVRELRTAFGAMPAELRKQLRPQLLAAARLIANQAKANAAWSTRIPGAITVGASFAKRTGGVRIRVNARKAPHARAHEGISNHQPKFRHPVFADPGEGRQAWTWVDQPTRPFLVPAVKAKKSAAVDRIRAAVQSATRLRSHP